ncbi:MAG TPA: hypothetical protein VL334_23615 [Anaerolineae bacterium]|nr:hypothetical protein [Anaerolineae bacterium]
MAGDKLQVASCKVQVDERNKEKKGNLRAFKVILPGYGVTVNMPSGAER